MVKKDAPVVPVITRVSADDVPGTNKRGRARTPSMFDDYMEISNEWVKVSFSSDTELKKIEADLAKAVKFANENGSNVGVERRTTYDALFFNVREKRIVNRKSATNGKSEDATAE